jgi:hypothetical protein
MYDSAFGGYTKYVIAHRRVDTYVASWWRKESSAKDITSKTSNWEVFKQFVCTNFWRSPRSWTR